MKVSGISAVVTGGASGLGAACVSRLADLGAHVVVYDLNAETSSSSGGRTSFVRGDVCDEEAVTAAMARAVEHAPLRVLVNCAGIGSGQRTLRRTVAGRFEAHDLEAFRRVVDVNLIGTFNCLRLAAKAMASSHVDDEECQGVVVNTASIAAFEGQVGQVAYAAAKAGIVGMTIAAARDLASSAIRVNTIAPGLIDTPILAPLGDLVHGLTEDLVFPRRMGRPEEFASLALSLIENDFINGETVRLDAGARMPPRSPARSTPVGSEGSAAGRSAG